MLLIAVVVLAADAIWLHVKCARQADELAALTERVSALASMPVEPTFADKAKHAYDKMKSAAVKGFKAAREEYLK